LTFAQSADFDDAADVQWKEVEDARGKFLVVAKKALDNVLQGSGRDVLQRRGCELLVWDFLQHQQQQRQFFSSPATRQ
jgi:hypothetical protein